MKKCLFFFLLICIPFYSFAHDHHAQPSDLAASFAVDMQGILWRVYAKDGFIQVDRSQDFKTFTSAVRINPAPQDLMPMGEVRPKIALGTQGEIYVAWMENLKPRFAGYIWFARSMDGGKTFKAPYLVHQDRAEIGHAFEVMQVAPNGDVTMIWLDSRDSIAAKESGKPHVGSSVYYAVSKDRGNSFSPEQKLVDGSCECCRIATAVNPKNRTVALFRYVFEGSERDHMIAEIPLEANQAPILKRASYGKWQVDGCPHHGAAIAAGGEGENWWGYHFAYFDGNEKKPGLYYSRLDGKAWAFSPPKKFGNHQQQAGRPALISQAEKVWLVWREQDKKSSRIYGQYSENDGKDWTDAKVLMTAEGKIDYPQLLRDGTQIHLLWNTEQGLKVERLQ